MVGVNIELLKMMIKNFNYDWAKDEDYKAYHEVVELIRLLEPDYEPL